MQVRSRSISRAGSSVPSRCHASSRSSAGVRPRATNRSTNAATASAVVGVGVGSRERVGRGGEAPLRCGRERGMGRGRRARRRPTGRSVSTVATAARIAASGSFTSTARDRGGDAPPRARERVDHAELEPAAWPHRREQRAEVVLEVVGGGPAQRVSVLDPIGEREAGRDRDVVGGAATHQHHVGVECVARPRLSAVDTVHGGRRAGGIDRRATRRGGSSASRVGRPSTKGELANAAASTGPSAWVSRQRASISSGGPRSRFTCIAAVLRIIVRPASPVASKYDSIAS